MSSLFIEYASLPVYGGSRTEMTARRTGIALWSEINLIFYELFPPPIGGFVQFPALLPGSVGLYADKVSYRPFPTSNAIITSISPLNAYQYCEIAIDYKTMSLERSPGAGGNILTRRISTGGEFMTLPNLGLKWNSGEVVKNNDMHAGKFVGMEQINLTFHRVPNPPPYATLRGLRGKVNSATFEGRAAETLLYLGTDFSQTIAFQGDNSWQVEIHMLERVIDGEDGVGWNHFFNSETGDWERLKQSNDEAIYKTTNFAVMY